MPGEYHRIEGNWRPRNNRRLSVPSGERTTLPMAITNHVYADSEGGGPAALTKAGQVGDSSEQTGVISSKKQQVTR